MAKTLCAIAIGWVAGSLSLQAASPADGAYLRIAGSQIELITDLPGSQSLEELPVVFEQALPLWADYFDLPIERLLAWRMKGFVVRSEERFRRSGDWPADLPPFLHGFQRGDMLWVREQPSDYYLRHLWLHEGTHGVMGQFLGTTGPPWLAEGLAELLATHQWRDGRLQLGVMPVDKEEVPYWGRIKLIREDVVANRPFTVDDVVALRGDAFQEVRGYAWSWALVSLLDQHPRWSPIFRKHLRELRPGPPGIHELWTRRLLDALRAEELASDEASSQLDPPLTLEETWQLMIDQLDYGYEIADESVVTAASVRQLQDRGTASVDSQLGWQSSGWLVKKGERYRLTATGRYRVKQSDRPWMSEAGGITIAYNRGLPLGILLVAVRSRPGSGVHSSLVHPTPIGLEAEWSPDEDGVVYFRINETAGARRDNSGQLEIVLQRMRESGERGATRAKRSKPD